MGLIHADPEFIAKAVALEDRAAVQAFRPAVSSREVELMASLGRTEAEAGRLREMVRDLNALVEKQASLIGAQRDELRTLKGTNATPQSGCAFFEACVGDATVLCEYEHTPASEPIFDADHPGVGPGHDAEVCLIQILVNGQWIDPTDMLSEKHIADIEQRIVESLE